MTLGRRAVTVVALVAGAALTVVLLGAQVDTDSPATSPARIAWFYRPPADGTSPATIASRHSEMILTGRVDRAYRAELRTKGWKDEVWQYLEQPVSSAPLNGPCGSFPEQWELWENQVAWNHRAGVAGSNDFCRHIDQNESWMLHSAETQQRVTRRYGNQIQYYMNPGSVGWREFFAERMQRGQEQWGYSGVFLDDLWSDSVQDGQFREYPTRAAYEQAVVQFIEDVRTRVPGVRIIGNAERPHVYAAALDGWLYEAFAGDWKNAYQPESEILGLWTLATQDSAEGKEVILVAQGDRYDFPRFRYAFAAYLMVAHLRVAFRYTESNHYSELWDYPEYHVRLGEPTGDRYRTQGSIWRRDFTAGTALVNLSAEPATISFERPYETVDGERVQQVTLPAKGGAILRLVARN